MERMPIPIGLCQCGCGESTRRWIRNDKALGAVRGEIRKFVDESHGHRKSPPVIETGRFKIDGVYCRLIPLDKGLFAIIEESDFDYVVKFRWVSRWNATARTHYAVRYYIVDGKRSIMSMHREIMGLKWKEKGEVDHRQPGNGLDNRRANLRITTHSGNQMNKRTYSNNSLGLKGIHPRAGGYRAVISAGGRHVWSKNSKSLEVLVAARAEALLKFHGEFARKA